MEKERCPVYLVRSNVDTGFEKASPTLIVKYFFNEIIEAVHHRINLLDRYIDTTACIELIYMYKQNYGT